MKTTARVMLLLAGLGACFPQPVAPPAVKLETRFDPSTVAWADAEGENRIEGTALLRTVGGEARTCAALNVEQVRG